MVRQGKLKYIMNIENEKPVQISTNCEDTSKARQMLKWILAYDSETTEVQYSNHIL